jgi:hypothetical protein
LASSRSPSGSRTAIESRLLPFAFKAGLLGVNSVVEAADRARDLSLLTRASRDAPPFLIAHGDRDHVVAASESQALHIALSRAGAEYAVVLLGGAGHEGPGIRPTRQPRPDRCFASRQALQSHRPLFRFLLIPADGLGGRVTAVTFTHPRQVIGFVRAATAVYRADDWVRASLALRCREIGLWPDKILIEVMCKNASKTGLAVCDWRARRRWHWSLTESGRALFDGLPPP